MPLIGTSMNPYSLAAVKIYGGLFLMFFLFPAFLLSPTQEYRNGLPMLLWALGVFLGVCCSSALFGLLHYRLGGRSAGWAVGQSLVTLLGGVSVAALPALWAPHLRDMITVSGWIAFYAFIPILFCSVLYYGATQHELIKNNGGTGAST